MLPRGLVWSLAAALTFAALPPVARAQSRAEVAAARKLFDDALSDEQAKRFDAALEKFRRVQAVKDTPHVRFRIAACLEGLGKLHEAIDAYEATVQLGESDAKNGDVVKGSRDRIVELTKRVSALTITLGPNAPPDAEIELDHEKVPERSLNAPILLNPGPHEVVGTASGATTFRTSLTLAEGARLSLVVPLERTPAVRPTVDPPPNIEPPPPQPPGDGGGDVPVPAHASSGRRTWGWIGVGTGGALLVGSGVVLLLRHNDIATLESSCKDGVCPKPRESELTRVRSRAVTEGSVAGVLAVGGVVAAAAGVYLLFGPGASPSPAKPRATVSAFATPSAGGLDVVGSF
jgi:hypothetical protein